MKFRKLFIFALGFATVSLTSCDDYLEQDPPSNLTPDGFYTTEMQVQAVANQFYQDILNGFDPLNKDNDTDVQIGKNPNNKYSKNQYRTSLTNGDWNWGNVRNVNFMLDRIGTNFKEGKIQGSEDNIKQYLGEMHFFRAYCYFDLLQNFGDLPIIKQALPDDETTLIAASNRQPCNEVARFILADLDTAITDLKDGFDNRHQRINPDAAQLLRSRVALYMGTWLTNFKGTPFVPNGEGWPGAKSNSGYQYPSGSIDNEAQWFLQEAVKSSQVVADKYFNSLSVNNRILPQKLGDSNPYFEIWGTNDCSDHPEVLLWRQFSKALGQTNWYETNLEYNVGFGYTRALMEGYLMKDGKPIYDSQYTYCDTGLVSVTKDRDPRITLFLKVPGQINCFKNLDDGSGTHYTPVEPVPAIINARINYPYISGYATRKGMTFNRSFAGMGNGENAYVFFRATEALLNYMEAEYMLTKDVNSGNIIKYWRKVRECAGFEGEAQDPMVTINATDMSQPSEQRSWDAWTAGKVLTDKVLFNIRRERRSEMLSEGLRNMDLRRWRSLDQLISTPYHCEGFHLWNTPITNWYNNDANGYLVDDGSVSANVSSRNLSEYYRPHEVLMVNNDYKDGLTWHMAHYLEPLPLRQFMLTAPDRTTIDESPMYQNPYWPTVADEPAQQ